MSRAHFLVLHHDAARRDELTSLLRGAGHHAAVAPDGAAAAAAIGLPGFDAVVLDLQWPELDLTALRQAIRPAEPVEPEPLETAERRHIASVLRYTEGNKRRAAHILGISRSTLLHKVRKYGLASIAPLIASLTLLLGATALPGFAAAQAPGALPPGRVTAGTLAFEGHATVGDFTGTTTTVSGEMTGGADLTAVRGWVEAPVKTLKTGNGKRDRDLNKSMESDKYPTMRFDLVKVVPSGGSADSVTATLQGTLTLHGVGREVELPATIVVSDAEARVRTRFPLNVKDYEIGGLTKALGILKMSEHIEVQVDVRFQLGAGGAERR